MADVRLEVEGLDELRRVLRRAPEMAQAEMAISMQRATYRVETEAKRRAPVDTGRLRSSLTSRVRRGASSVEGTVGTRLHYAPYMEYGRGALVESKAWIEGEFGRTVERILRRLRRG